MQCIAPIYVKDQFVPCGKCNFCLQSRRLDWSFRLKQELKDANSADFLTLTYDDENIPINSTSGLAELRKEDLQLFTKRLRWYNTKVDPSPEWETVRYYSIGEYGTKFKRPHYHSIMFNMKEQTRNWLPEIWGLGRIHVGRVTDASIMYVAKYHLNKFEVLEGRTKPFACISNRSGGLGKNM